MRWGKPDAIPAARLAAALAVAAREPMVADVAAASWRAAASTACDRVRVNGER